MPQKFSKIFKRQASKLFSNKTCAGDRAGKWAMTGQEKSARKYLKAIAGLTGAKLFIASVGPGRDQTIFV